MFITFDQYYDINFYHQIINSMKNNGYNYPVYISIKTPYNWYIDIGDDTPPVFLNYDKLDGANSRFLVNRIIPMRPTDEVELYRRNDTGNKNISKYVNNTPLKEAYKSNYACFIDIPSKDFAIELSKEYPFKIWYMGKYFHKKYKVGLCTNSAIKMVLPEKYILLEKTSNELGQFEAMLNYKVFLLQDRLIKYSLTPYFENGQYYKPAYTVSDTSKFLVF